MPKTPKPPGGTPGPIPILLFKEEFEKLHYEHAIILDRIKGVEKLCQLILTKLGSSTVSNLSPELAAALIENASLVKTVDEKVPDKTVPPINGPSKFFPQTKQPPTSNERTFQ